MVSVSDDFIEQLELGNHDYLLSVQIILSDNTILPDITKDKLFEFTIEDAISKDNKFTALGGAVINQATIVISNLDEAYSDYDFIGANITLQLGLTLENTSVEYINMGRYTVDSATVKAGCIELICLDNMSKFDKDYSETLITSYPVTIQELVEDACTVCDVSLSGTIPYSTDTLDIVPDSVSTFREIIHDIAQITGTFARINRDGELYFGWFDKEKLQMAEGKRRVFSGDIVSFNITNENINVEDLEINIEPVQSGSGDPSPENVRPITGWTGCNITVANGLDDTAEDYEATVYLISWQTEAGTVYAGEMDVTTGVLKAYPYYASYNGETLTGHWISSMDKYVADTSPSIGAQVVNDGATPITYQLTPQELTLLKGTNNVWSDTGYISKLEYYDPNYSGDIVENVDNVAYIDKVSNIVPAQSAIDITGVHAYVMEGLERYEYSAGTNEFSIDLSGNTFLTSSNIQAILNRVANVVSGLTIRGLTMSHINNPLYEAGDVGMVTYRKKNGVLEYSPFVFTRTIFSVNKFQETVCGIETLLENKSARYTEAQRVSVNAQQLADYASRLATNYLSSDSSGIMVADLGSQKQTPANATGRNVKIDSDSVDIREGQEILASFGETTIIGKTDAAHMEATDARLSFKVGSIEIAYIAADPETLESIFYMTKAIVVQDLYFGKWQWKSRDNNNLALKWLGDDE